MCDGGVQASDWDLSLNMASNGTAQRGVEDSGPRAGPVRLGSGIAMMAGCSAVHLEVRQARAVSMMLRGTSSMT